MNTVVLESHPCILVIESDTNLAEKMSLDLQESGYDPVLASDPKLSLTQADRIKPDLIIIDRMLVGDSGLSICEKMRGQGIVAPILMLMAKDTVEDRVACLESGADDYFIKPYRPEEFLERLRLYLKSNTDNNEQLRFSDLILDLGTRKAFRDGRAIELTMKEFELLKCLMEHPRDVLTREQILEQVWGYDFMGESNVIEVYIRYLRLKIEHEGEKRLIQTVRGVGYVLREP
ncbi:response regulator transcription factor NblR [Roseofilum capinflatum]|uniref:Response regulator transcription factor n=1 Tax=Roseofilum capinflatum BLCC-M114 TaxID=3022440 RepID=A0ABT7BDG5_9CYAN|nr:response regulator transcription factor [Roseofilum capinflatum]MDJ1177225.1 response regulator transcription factor [Roseofilum capinflatum BLCC-M114]